MNTPLRSLAAVLMMVFVPAAAAAQGGKIDDVKRTAGSSGGGSDRHDDGGDHCNLLCGLLHAILFSHSDGSANAPAPATGDSLKPPELPTQTYAVYPWGGPRVDRAFVTRGPYYRPSFGVASMTYFKDAASTLNGMSVAVEGGFQEGRIALDLTVYDEQTLGDEDMLNTARLEIGGVGRLGRGFYTGGVGGRLVCLDNDECAYGGDVAMGARVLPLRPFILSANASLGGMKWHDGDWFLVTEYNTSAGLLLGRFEVGVGWHWLKLGTANAFGGPTFVGRVWF